MPLQKEAYRASTGYFARATQNGFRAKSTQVHLVSGNQALCGYMPHPSMQFQWCASYPELSYVECDKCKQKYLDKVGGITKEQRVVLDEIHALESSLSALRKAKGSTTNQTILTRIINEKKNEFKNQKYVSSKNSN